MKITGMMRHNRQQITMTSKCGPTQEEQGQMKVSTTYKFPTVTHSLTLLGLEDILLGTY